VRVTVNAAKPTATRTAGRFATLRAPLHAQGSGAPKAGRTRRLLCSAFVMAVGVLVFASAPALAAPLEAPELTVESVAATTATLHGVLNPNAESGAGTYEFIYKLGKAGCVGGTKVPVPAGLMSGAEHEEPSEGISGLTQGTEYTACVRAVNTTSVPSEEELSPAVTFTTAIPPEAPQTISPADSITATTATLEGILNPKKAGNPGSYEFIYRVSATECEGERSSPEPAGVMSGALKQAVSVPVTVLQPNAMYTFCLLARNAAGETAVGNAVHFTTSAAAPTILSESVSHHNKEGAPLASGEARLEGALNPNNQLTECHFQYGEGSVAEHEVPCEPELLKGFGEQDVAATVGGLTPGNTYHYRIVAKNGKGEEATGSEKTVLPPEAPATPTVPEAAITATTATFHGVLDPHSDHEAEPGTYEFVYRQSASECQHQNPQTGQEESEKTTPATAATGAEGEAVQAPVSELLPGTTYTLCLLAKNAAGEEALGPPATFTTLAVAPAVESESAIEVTAESASLEAQVDPGGAETTYHFEYLSEAQFEANGETFVGAATTPESASIGAGDSGLPAEAELQELRAATIYHYRIVVTSTKGSVDGIDHTFTTQGSSTELTLPDGRQWEMVTPPNKQGTLIIPPGNEGGDDIRAAQSGDAITYGATSSLVPNAAGNRALDLSQGFSTRRTPGSWETIDITTPHNEGPLKSSSTQDEYQFFSSDLSLGLLEPDGHTPLSPGASERTVYLRNDSSGEYQALVTAANVPPGTKFGGEGEVGSGGVEFGSATPNLSHVLLRSDAALTSTPVGAGGGLYEWSGGQLQLVSVLPPSEGGGPTNGYLGGTGEGTVVRHAISNDGSRVLWRTFGGGLNTLYMRDTVRGETVRIAKGGNFETANEDASRVFFREEEGGVDQLGVFEVTSGSNEPLAGSTVRLTGSGDLGNVIGSSENGEYVYFVDTGVLGDGAAHGAENGGNNLYVERYEEAAKAWAPPMFIAALSSEDYDDWESQVANMTSRVSPNGRYLAFMSDRSLTGYDNRDANSGVPDEEVFLYDADTGQLACASCDPTGARPVGISVNGDGFELMISYNIGVWGNKWLAANIPTWTQNAKHLTNYQPRYLSNEGRLFFNSVGALVPADVNGKADVYEYEPSGVGSCQPPGYGQSASVVFVEKIGGCVGLISAGTSSEESAFMEASETGNDVFFLTLSRLSPQDYDTNLDIYDAHECTPSSPCAPASALSPPPCSTGDACKPAPTPQPTIFGAPAGETFKGAGNPAPPPPAVVKPKPKAKTVKCRKGLRKDEKNGKCVVRHEHKGKKKHRAKKIGSVRS
jgi:hypothetical protein